MLTLSSPYGPIELWPCADPAVIARLDMDSSLSVFRPAGRQQEALVGIAGDTDGCVTFAKLGHLIVGYAAFHPPDPIERWSQTKLSGIIELGAVETSSSHRGRHLARRLLETAFNTGRFEDKITIATIYQWHFDLEGTSLTTYQYRKLLERLYGSVGFQVFKTDDPEIQYDPGNALMARIGPNAPEALRAEFNRLLFLGDSADLERRW
jgi:acetoin utilization protein AcuA